MKIPGPDHPIHIRAADQRWRARFQGHVIADSAGALVLEEGAYPQVIYFPREDVSMEYLSRTTHSTHCPYKGDASYYSILMDGHLEENAVWTYEGPYPAMQAIDGYLAFYPDKVEVYAVDDAAVNPRHVAASENVDEIVQHTDAGDGHAQRGQW
ncbi:MAG: DUF427 domain-containing protein, partial [Phenylobacterium sp.]|nr:DUF427 domain-containing protein [Phenylobacterium sp.]